MSSNGPGGEFTDLHGHLLPGVDDGAKDLAEALAMARLAVAEGITTAMATPHTFDGVYEVDRTVARAALAQLTEALAAAGVPLQVRLAAEVHLHERIPAALREDPSLTLDGRGRYLLLELPHQGPPPALSDFLFRLAASGTTAVIAHPERNLAVRRDPGMAVEWARRGTLMQLTAGSLTGAFGAPIRACAEHLLRHGAAHVVATDTHSTSKRPPLVRDAWLAAAAVVGEDGADALFRTHPACIVAGEAPAAIRAPVVKRRRGLLALWGR